MIEFAGRVILLDIEGTTSPVAFVFDVMFPFVRRELPDYLARHWLDERAQQSLEQVARDAGRESLAAWLRAERLDDEPARQQAFLVEHLLSLMDRDAKATGLKELQGLIWEDGFHNGELEAELFDDVPIALLAWNAQGRDVRIYSSGSIHAQKLFFGHTTYGDLLNQFRGHYDTTSGPKKEAASYRAIAAEIGTPPDEILFLSDIVAELDAARAAGLHTGLCRRPGNADPPEAHGHAEISSFAQVRLID